MSYQYAKIDDGAVVDVITTIGPMPAHKLHSELLPLRDQRPALALGESYDGFVDEVQADQVVRTWIVQQADLANLKALKLRALADRRWRASLRFEFDGVETYALEAIPAITAAIVARQVLDSSEPQVWKLADGEFRLWTTEELVAFGADVNSHVQGCFDNERTLTAQIEIAESVEALDAVDIEAGWP